MEDSICLFHGLGSLKLGVKLLKSDELLLNRAALRFGLLIDCGGNKD